MLVPRFDTTIQLAEPAEAVQSRIALAVARFPAQVEVRPGLITITRRFRPVWAKVLGIIGLILMGLGILFFLVKKTEVLTISVSPRGDDESTVVVGGELQPWMIPLVQSAISGSWTRKCPQCNQPMPRTESVCPSCQSESKPWIHHAGLWWFRRDAGAQWEWYDDNIGAWRWYANGRPSGSAVDQSWARKHLIDPALVSPPEDAR